MRPIDADAILKGAEESFKNAGLHGEDYRKFKKWLRKAPTIDAVEVVRCKDCIHYESDGGAMMICNITDMVCDNDDYCSYGERREDGQA